MQLRLGPQGGVYGLDFNAVLATAAFAGVRGRAAILLTDVLSPVERLVVHAYRKDDET
jgi:hypothetical protein